MNKGKGNGKSVLEWRDCKAGEGGEEGTVFKEITNYPVIQVEEENIEHVMEVANAKINQEEEESVQAYWLRMGIASDIGKGEYKVDFFPR